jgi:hypothetical protein
MCYPPGGTGTRTTVAVPPGRATVQVTTFGKARLLAKRLGGDYYAIIRGKR